MATQVTAKTASDYPHILLAGLQASYNGITTKDPSKLYFCTDSGKLYKGGVDFTKAVRIVSSDPTSAAERVDGLVYINTTTGFAKTWDATNSEWVTIGTPTDTFADNPIDVESDENHVPTSKNVYEFVTDAVADAVDSVVTSVAAKTGSGNNGKIVVTTGAGQEATSSDVTVPGVLKGITFEPSTRTFTFSSTTESDVTVTLAKDIFIDPEANNRYDPVDQSIHLYLNDGEGTSEPTELVIPVASLIATIEVADTDTVDMTLTTKQKQVGTSSVSYQEIKAAVKLKPDVANTFTNAIQSSTAGIYVDLAPVESRLDTIEGADSVTGSIAYAVKQLADGQVADNATDIGTLDDNMALLATATTTWGTF